MTTEDIRNLQARLTRMGDTDAARQVGVLLAAFEDACECIGGWSRTFVDPDKFLAEAVGREGE